MDLIEMNKNLKYILLLTLGSILAFSSILPTFLGTNSNNVEVAIAPTSEDVDKLVEEYNSRFIEEENLYLIYFNNKEDFQTFVNNFDVKMTFKALLGAVIQSLPSDISEIVNTYRFLKTSDFHHLIEGSPLKVIYSGNNPGVTYSMNTIETVETLGIKNMWDLGYYGNGSRIGIMDNGILANHPDFEDRVKNKTVIVNTIYGNDQNRTGEPGSHGTPVAGVAAGAGIINPDNIGMAPGAWLYDMACSIAR